MKRLIMFFVFVLFLVIGSFIFMNGCTNDDEPETPKSLPVVSTNEVYNITYTTAEVSGTITSDGNSPVDKSGFCWSESPSPTIDDDKTVDGQKAGNFRTNIQNLEEGVTYYVRAYATNSMGTGYGNEISFSTELSCQTMVLRHPGYEVWAGDTPYFSFDNHYDYFYSIDKYDYHFIGEGTTTKTFNTGNYKYYVIVSKYWNCVDAIQFKDGSYYAHGQGYTLFSGLTEVDKITGAPDGVFGVFGYKTLCPPEGKATYNAFITDDATILSRGGELTIYVGSGCQ